MIPLAMGVSFVGVALVCLAYLNRRKPAWQRDMRAIIILAVGQVLLGTTIAVIDILSR